MKEDIRGIEADDIESSRGKSATGRAEQAHGEFELSYGCNGAAYGTARSAHIFRLAAAAIEFRRGRLNINSVASDHRVLASPCMSNAVSLRMAADASASRKGRFSMHSLDIAHAGFDKRRALKSDRGGID